MIGMMKYQSAYLKEAHKVFDNAVVAVHVLFILGSVHALHSLLYTFTHISKSA